MGGSYADVGGLNPVTGGSYAGAGNQTTRSTPESGYRRFSCRQSPKNLGGDGTIATHRWFNRRNFWKSGSLHFSNSDLNLMLTNPMLQPDDGPRSSLGIELGSDDVVGSHRSSLGDLPKGSGSSLGTHRKITVRRPEDSPQECRRLPDWWELGLDYLDWSLSVVIIES
ncbi:hypothetical protein GW17_00052411 [Ensete ventricosum]|nr:hypothetical protein GW17_00052411 [Ensete ventricosum]